LLFVLAADVLQSLVNDAMNHGLLSRPIPLQSSPWFPILQYADDTLIILQADEQQLSHLQTILQDFGNVSGLRVNYSKSNLIPINITPDRVAAFTSALQCQEGSLPFTYLGLPLSTTKPRKEFFLPLIQTVQRRLPSCTMYLNYGSKLRMVNSVLSSLPMFFLCSLKVYQWVIHEVDKFRRHCLWRDKDLQKKNPPLAAWDLVCRPKDQGGLGVLNLTVQNNCLLMKHLHKFYNKADIPWVTMAWEMYYTTVLPPARIREVSFWWRDCLSNLTSYKQLASCTFHQGNSILLWQDAWSQQPLKDTWPHLYSYCISETISLKQALLSPDAADLFHLPLSEEAVVQFHLFQALLASLVTTQDNTVDSWAISGRTDTLKVSSVYKSQMHSGGALPAFQWMWQSCCQQKHKVFFLASLAQ
jgi:hypothetical protein